MKHQYGNLIRKYRLKSHSMLPSSADLAMPFSSQNGEQYLPHESLSHKKKRSYAHCDKHSQDKEALTTINFCSNSDSNRMGKRRKLQKSTVVVFPVDSDIEEVPDPSNFESFPIRASVVAEEKYDRDLGVERDDKIDPIIQRENVTNMRECANSDIMSLNVYDDDNSLKELCIAVLRSNGLLGVLPVRSHTATEVVGSDSASTEFCRKCGSSENVLKMLICDNCEDAYHKHCCNPRMKNNVLSIDEWFCSSCSKLEHKLSPEIYFRKSLRFGLSTMSAKHELGPIEYMLRYPEQHISRVRIGEAFQAEVPELSGESSKDVDCIVEPSELDLGDTIAPTHRSEKNPRRKSITNWLQCQEPVYDDSGKSVEGAICGKWRRAPLSESQIDDWDCFCSVLWDPRYSDCAVPQELETGEVLSQLKYIEQLKSRLAGRKKE